MMEIPSPRWPIVAICVAGVSMAAGAGSGFLAWKQDSLTLALSAAVLLLSAPAIAVASSLALMKEIGNDGAFALRTIRMARANTLVAVSYAVVLGFCQWNGMIDAAAFVWSYGTLCALATACYLPWLARRETQVREHHATCRQRLAAHKENCLRGG